jgi:type IV pilus assembly protein PilB
MSDDPIRRFTLLVLFQAQEDRATELVITPSIGGGIRYKVDGTWYDMSPPPSHILPSAVAELGRLAELPEGPFPKEGIIDVAYFGLRLRWKIHLRSAEAECVLTPLTP